MLLLWYPIIWASTYYGKQIFLGVLTNENQMQQKANTNILALKFSTYSIPLVTVCILFQR